MELIRFKPREAHDFYETVCRRVHEHMENRGLTKYGTGYIWLKAGVFGAVALSSYLLIVLKLIPIWTMPLMAIVHGIGLLGFLLNAAHDTAHSALTRHHWLGEAILNLTFYLLGINGYLWKQRHVHSHHVFPNINGCDTDVDDNPVLRFSPNAPYRPWFRYQHYYALFAYCLLQLQMVYVKDFFHWARRDYANLRNIRHQWAQAIFFALNKLTHISVYLIIPYLVMNVPFWQILVGYLSMSFVTSMLFVLFFAGTHFADACIFPTRPENGKIPLTYAEHAMLASLDWEAKNPLWHFLVGGINAHAAHHLFPHLCHTHYIEITPIIEATAKEFGLQYNSTSLWGMLKSHFSLLKKLSVPNEQFTDTQKKLIFQVA